MELPLAKVKATKQDPENLILFGSPKIGKTTLLSELEGCIILDLERGSDYVDAVKVQLNSLEDIIEFCKAVKKAGCPYKFAAIDTITVLEELADPLAVQLYQETEKGKSFKGTSAEIPYGGQTVYLPRAVKQILEMIRQVVPNIILVAHVKNKTIVDYATKEEGDFKDIALTKGVNHTITVDADGIGYIHRDLDSNLVISFQSQNAAAGSRAPHLANKSIIVVERNEDGSNISHWDRIYPSLLAPVKKKTTSKKLTTVDDDDL